MGLETGTYISDLVATNPLGSDQKSTTDDHLRLIKSTIKASFPNVNGAVNPTPTQFNYLVGVTSAIQTQIDSKGAVAGQTWTGTHAFPSTTSIGTVTGTEISYLSGVTSAIQTQINAKGAVAGQAWTGTHTFVTQAANDNSTKVATTAYADRKGAITGQAWTGSHTFPTQSQGNNSTLVATTAYVDAFAPIGAWVRLSSATASASASVSFTSLITSTYDLYIVEFENVKPATGGASLQMKTSANNGSTYDTSYNATAINTPANSMAVSTGAVTQIPISGSMPAAHEGYSGIVYIIRPSVAQKCQIYGNGVYIDNTTTYPFAQMVYANNTNAAIVNAVQFFMSSGNIASGVINLYGVKKS